MLYQENIHLSYYSSESVPFTTLLQHCFSYRSHCWSLFAHAIKPCRAYILITFSRRWRRQHLLIYLLCSTIASSLMCKILFRTFALNVRFDLRTAVLYLQYVIPQLAHIFVCSIH